MCTRLVRFHLHTVTSSKPNLIYLNPSTSSHQSLRPQHGAHQLTKFGCARLNRFVIREQYQSPTPAQAVSDIAASDAKIFTVLDALKGYHQCPLDKDSQTLTTFITPFGRYRYLRAPYGISSISEHYNRRMAEAFKGLSGFR